MAGINLWRGERSPGSLLHSWDSFGNEIERMFKDMDRMLTPFRTSSFQDNDLVMTPSCDVRETDSAYVLSFDIPGIAKDDLNIEVQGNQLVLSGERKREHEGTEGSYYHAEKRYGRFQRFFTLPEGTDTDKIEARYENGVLHLAVPKTEQAKPRKINIEEEKGGFLKKLVHRDTTKEEPKKVS